MKKTIIDALMDWLKTCPELTDGEMNIDWLPADARGYSVDVVECQPVLKRYSTGTTKKQFIFYLVSREFLGDDIRDAQDNYTFYEAFAAWVEKNSLAGNLPDLGEGRAARSIEVNTSGYPIYVSEDGRARYQIQLKLIYAEEA